PLGGQLRKPLRAALREPALEDELRPFAIPPLTQLVQERIPPVGGWGSRPQVADPVDLTRRLRRSGKRHRETQSEGDDNPDGAVPHGALLESALCRPSSSH